MIDIRKNFLPVTLIDDINLYISKNIGEPKWYTNIAWPEYIVIAGNQVSILPLKVFEDRIKQTYINYRPEFKNSKIMVQYYVWQRGSHISWHYDKDPKINKMGSTIYLNKQWDKNDGGLYLYEENKKIHAEVPEFNKMILKDSTLYHGVSMLTNTAKQVRKTLQIWIWK